MNLEQYNLYLQDAKWQDFNAFIIDSGMHIYPNHFNDALIYDTTNMQIVTRVDLTLDSNGPELKQVYNDIELYLLDLGI